MKADVPLAAEREKQSVSHSLENERAFLQPSSSATPHASSNNTRKQLGVSMDEKSGNSTFFGDASKEAYLPSIYYANKRTLEG